MKWVLIVMVALVSCSKVMDSLLDKNADSPYPGYKTYHIKKGAHYSLNRDGEKVSGQLRFHAIFDSSCIYTNSLTHNQQDINKLYGFSDCSTDHHENSARFGWRWNGKAMEIHAYCYTDSIRNSILLGEAKLEESHFFALRAERNRYIFTFKDKEYSIARHCADAVDGYQLFPYFGGDEPAPHDMKIFIKEL